MSWENFNATNETALRFKRHMNFVTSITLPSCAMVESLPYGERCEYVHNTKACTANVFLVDYVDLLYCKIQPENLIENIAAMALLIFICAYFFLCLGIVADAFFCPAVEVLAKLMRLNENVAGVTLLAMGNNVPEICTSFAVLDDETRSVYSDIMGSSAFVLIFIVGVIITLRPLEVVPMIYLRDAAFLTVAVMFINVAIQTDNKVTVVEGFLIVAIYVIYIIVVLVDQFLIQYTLTKFANTGWASKQQREDYIKMLEQSGIQPTSRDPSLSNSWTSLNMENAFSMALMHPPGLPVLRGKNYQLWHQFIHSFKVINKQLWSNATIFHRIFLIARIPALFIFKSILPMVNSELALKGWSKLLNCLQLAFTPSLALYAVGIRDNVYGTPVPYYALTALITVPLAILVFVHSRTDTAPRYHRFFSILVIFGAACMIQLFANEVVCILGVLGIVMHCSPSYLGVTLLCWGNCVGDFIACIALTRYGFQKMALASCFAGPLCCNCVILGVAYVYKALFIDNYRPTRGPMGPNCFYFMSSALFIFTLFATFLTNFELRRSIGICLILTYALFVIYTTMGEAELIHPYGSEHIWDSEADNS